MRGLVRAAFETASEKRTVPGAAKLICELQAEDPSARVSILSGSPTQMRAVLEEKLALDGVRIDQLTLKDNLGNLKRGRLSAVRAQIGFKLPYLLEHRLDEKTETQETLFGDDSETDALVYASYAALLAGELDLDAIVEILRAGNAYPDAIERAIDAGRKLVQARTDAVCDIFIRVDRGVPLAIYRLLGPRISAVFSWYQAALVLFARGRLRANAVEAVLRATSSAPEAGDAWIVDAVRRGLVERQVILDLLDGILSSDLAEGSSVERAERANQTRRALDRLGPSTSGRPDPLARPDFLRFLSESRR